MDRMLMKAALVVVLLAGAGHALDVSELPDPGQNLRVGQWAVYSIMGAEQKQTISKIEGEGDERMITIVFESSADDESDTIESVISVKELQNNPEDMPDDEKTTLTTETRTIGGKKIEVVILNVDGEESGSRLALSRDVPISGIVFMEAAGMGMMMELLDFGDN